MGNTCIKDLTTGKLSNSSNQKYKNTELVNTTHASGGDNANERSLLVKGSQVKYAIVHPQVKDILARLSYEEIQILLVSLFASARCLDPVVSPD
jgi:hypothetical protein